MALTNAEKQKRWRDRRNALADRAMKSDVQPATWGSIAAENDALREKLAQAEARIEDLLSRPTGGSGGVVMSLRLHRAIIKRLHPDIAIGEADRAERGNLIAEFNALGFTVIDDDERRARDKAEMEAAMSLADLLARGRAVSEERSRRAKAAAATRKARAADGLKEAR